MPRIVTDKANFFKQLSILHSPFTAKLSEITNAALAIADISIEHNNKLRELTAGQLQDIAAYDINELKERLIGCYEPYSNQITDLKPDTIVPHGLIASATNNLRRYLNKGLITTENKASSLQVVLYEKFCETI